MVDEMVALHTNGTWVLFLYLLVNLQLDVVGSILLKLVLMVRLIALRPTWLLKLYSVLFPANLKIPPLRLYKVRKGAEIKCKNENKKITS